MSRAVEPTINALWYAALIQRQTVLTARARSRAAEFSAQLSQQDDEFQGAIRQRLASLGSIQHGRLRASQGRSLRIVNRDLVASRRQTLMAFQKPIRNFLVEVIKDERQFLADTLLTISPVELDLQFPTVEAVLVQLDTTPIITHPFEGTFSQFVNSDGMRLSGQVQFAVFQGQSLDQIFQSLDPLLNRTRAYLETVVLTMFTSAISHTQARWILSNKNLMDRELWFSQDDGRTGVICLDLADRQFALGAGPLPPTHWRCRSRRIGVLNAEVFAHRTPTGAVQAQLLQVFATRNQIGKVGNRESLPRGLRGKYDEFVIAQLRQRVGSVHSMIPQPVRGRA